MIFNYSLIKKHKVLLDIINNCILFSLRYCSYLKASIVLIPIMPITQTEIISMILSKMFLETNS